MLKTSKERKDIMKAHNELTLFSLSQDSSNSKEYFKLKNELARRQARKRMRAEIAALDAEEENTGFCDNNITDSETLH